MIFVTVGTHEQPFDRLIKKVDELKENGVIQEEVIVQKGYSKYTPKKCTCYDLIPWEKMQELNKEARIVITHGGPASFVDVLKNGKIPIVVPRQKEFGEHVNNHQLDFCRKLIEKNVSIVLIENINDLQNAILDYGENGNCKLTSNNEAFNEKIIQLTKNLFEEAEK